MGSGGENLYSEKDLGKEELYLGKLYIHGSMDTGRVGGEMLHGTPVCCMTVSPPIAAASDLAKIAVSEALCILYGPTPCQSWLPPCGSCTRPSRLPAPSQALLPTASKPALKAASSTSSRALQLVGPLKGNREE